MSDDYDGLTPRERIVAYVADTPYRCDACSVRLMTVREHDLPGGTRFRFCKECAEMHSAVPVREEVTA